MVERVKAALIAEDESVGGTRHAAYWDDMARAAIEAMREPTEEMISADALQLELVLAVKAAWAACDMIVEGPTSVASVACTAVLDHLKARAVIDAALKEGD
jgi:nucleoside-diphosphate-sugar epimerase